MVTGNAVGGSNEPTKREDELQVEIPESFKDLRYFSSVEEAQRYANEKIKDGYLFDGHYFKAGKVIAEPLEDGRVPLLRCPVGELSVRCVEKACKMMRLPVNITGDYLVGYMWSDSH